MNQLSRRNSAASGESLLGDEELEEGLLDNVGISGREGGEGEGQGRLSRELEVGFRDESDQEDAEEVRLGSRGRR